LGRRLQNGALYGLGVFLASYSADKVWWLYLSYGFIGGLGLGLGYIVPVAVLVKWFPDTAVLLRELRLVDLAPALSSLHR